MTRRRFIATAGALLSGLISGCVGSESDSGPITDTENNSSKKEREDTNQTSEISENGAVVITYDDGAIHDYTEAFPIHQEYDAPATVGVVTDLLNQDQYEGGKWMNVDQLSVLENHGWEIASHTTHHTDIGQVYLTKDITPGDDRIYPTRTNHADHAELLLEITDGEKSVIRTVLGGGEDSLGPYIQLDEEINQPFKAESTVERYASSEMNHFLGESKAILEKNRFTVDTLIAPYDAFGEWARQHAEQHYLGVVNAYSTEGHVNSPIGFDPFETKRDYFIENTSQSAIKHVLDKISQNGSLAIFAAHTEKDLVSPDEIRTILEMIDKHDIKVLTMRDAINLLH